MDQEDAKAVSLRVQTMQCKFALDPNDKVIFLYCEYTAVEIENARKEIEEYMVKEKEGRNESAAIAVSNELLDLLIHARTRGLTLEQAFAHFDASNSGFIDTDMLIDGMAKLGIGVTYPVGEGVLQIIGGIGSGFISINEFSNYFLSPHDVELFNGMNNKSSSSNNNKSKLLASTSKELTNKNSFSKAKTNKKIKVVINAQLLPPPKDNLSINKDFMNLEASQSIAHDWQQLQYEQVGATAGVLQSNTASVDMELPLPLSAYSTALGGNVDQSSLPTWAAKRSHRALKQLHKTQNRWMNKQQTNTSETSTFGDDISSYSGSNNSQLTDKNEKSDFKKDHRLKFSPPKLKDDKSKVSTLTLNAIVTSMNEDLTRNADELLHVDHGVIMTYRLLNGSGNDFDKRKTHEKTDSLRYKSFLKERETNFNKSFSLKLEGSNNSSNNNRPNTESKSNDFGTYEILSFTLVIVPDLFMTLDTLQTHFQPLLHKFPYAQILLIGLPGLPNTVWPNNWVLNSDLQSRSIAKLLQHLVQSEKLHKSSWSISPIFFMVFIENNKILINIY